MARKKRKEERKEREQVVGKRTLDDQLGAIGSSPDSNTNELMTVGHHLIFLGPSSLIY